MTFIFQDADEPQIVKLPVTIDGGEFTLVIERPEFEHFLDDAAWTNLIHLGAAEDSAKAFKSRYLGRENRVIGWEGLLDQHSRPIEFNRSRLHALLANFGSVAIALNAELCRLFTHGDKPSSVPVETAA